MPISNKHQVYIAKNRFQKEAVFLFSDYTEYLFQF